MPTRPWSTIKHKVSPDRLARIEVEIATIVDGTVRNWLRGYGAPIVQAASTEQPAPPLEELVALGLRLTHTDASVARAMPIVLWRNRARLRFDELTRVARLEGEGATLGLF